MNTRTQRSALPETYLWWLATISNAQHVGQGIEEGPSILLPGISIHQALRLYPSPIKILQVRHQEEEAGCNGTNVLAPRRPTKTRQLHAAYHSNGKTGGGGRSISIHEHGRS